MGFNMKIMSRPICIAFTNDIPKSVRELDMMSELAFLKEEKTCAIAYTVWSRKRGAGKEIVNKVIEFAKKRRDKKSSYFISINTSCDTFSY